MTTTSTTATCDFYRWGYLKGTVYMCFGGCAHWNPHTLYGK